MSLFQFKKPIWPPSGNENHNPEYVIETLPHEGVRCNKNMYIFTVRLLYFFVTPKYHLFHDTFNKQYKLYDENGKIHIFRNSKINQLHFAGQVWNRWDEVDYLNETLMIEYKTSNNLKTHKVSNFLVLTCSESIVMSAFVLDYLKNSLTTQYWTKRVIWCWSFFPMIICIIYNLCTPFKHDIRCASLSVMLSLLSQRKEGERGRSVSHD